MEQESTYVGIDVAKAQVDVAVRPTGQRWVVSYDESGVGELVAQLEDLDPALVLLEASGGLELPLVAALAAAALPVVVVNPRQVRDFARATGTLAKTDALDAAVLAHFADAVRPSVRPLRDAETQVLNSLAARRHQVMTMLVSEKNRLGTAITSDAGDILFATRTVDPVAAAQEARRSGLWASAEVTDSLWPSKDQRTRPLMPLRRGHMAMLIAAGFLDNLQLEADGRRILVKGKTTKELVLVEETPDKVTYRERLRTTVVALDLGDGEITDIAA